MPIVSKKPLTEKLLPPLYDDEARLESDAVREGVLKYRDIVNMATERGEAASLKPAERMMIHWLRPFIAAIKDEKQAIRDGDFASTGRAIYGPFLMLLDDERLAVAAMHEALGLLLREPSGVKMSSLAYAVGNAIIAEIHSDEMRHVKIEVAGRKGSTKQVSSLGYLHRIGRDRCPRQINRWAKRNLDHPKWKISTCIQIGVSLVWLLIASASADDYEKDFVRAFLYEMRREKKKTHKYVRLNEAVFHRVNEGHRMREFLRPRYLPMVIPPCAWSDEEEGGYRRIRTPFMSKPTHDHKAALADADLSRVYDALNALNHRSWRINKKMLAVAKIAWEDGGGALGIPATEDAPYPPRDIEWSDVDARKQWKRAARNVYRDNLHLHADREIFLQRMSVADRMVKYDAFWQPHQLDFRGRCYPIPPHLNHQGDDLCRGLMEFADARPWNDDARRWMLIHAANSYGVDKLPFSGRIEWANDHGHQIERCAADPLGSEFWREAEKPWQFLAACTALHDQEAGAHLPVQLDGTCNGLQTYAALARDPVGAATVNLMPSDTPADVYTDVLDAVRPVVERDARAGVYEAQIIMPLLCRKFVKQPVMTNVYGVTAVGARKQILARLQEIGLKDDDLYECSYYLARVTMGGIGEVCHGAAEIMDWLQECARIISKKCKQLVRWTTPLGLPVVQPYRKSSELRVDTISGKLAVDVMGRRAPVAIGRQKKGAPPNFIHSLDATHMFMVAEQCHRDGVAFAEVHDSFWTHAADAGNLGVITRDQFVKLHERPILHDLWREWQRRYDKADFPPPPEQGDFDLSLVRDSEYFFS